MAEISYKIRKATLRDRNKLLLLYKKVTSYSSGLARMQEEVTQEYIASLLEKATKNGLALVVLENNKIVGSMIKYVLEPKSFAHILTQGSLLVDPEYQCQGIGTKLLTSFLQETSDNYPHILRVEIVVRESSPVFKLYEQLGFIKEGRYEKGIKTSNQKYEAGIPMVWFNPKFGV